MSAPSRKNKDAPRVVCQCKARQCYLGHFVDAYGQPQSGVEVLLSTRDAHARADLRKQLLEGNVQPNTHQQPIDDLMTHFEQIHLPAQDLPPVVAGSESGHSHTSDSTRQHKRFASNPQGHLHHESPLLEHVGTESGNEDDSELPQNTEGNDKNSSIPSNNCGM